jgi:hypothetical protein
MALNTTRNVTILGIAGIVVALGNAAIMWFDGDPATNVDFGGLINTLYMAVIALLAKGSGSTGPQTILGKPLA